MNQIKHSLCILIALLGTPALALDSCPFQRFMGALPTIQPALYLDGSALADSILSSAHLKIVDRKFNWGGLKSLYTLATSQPIAYPGAQADEQALQSWIAQQNEFSIELHAFFERALEITGFDVARALALSWNTLRENSKSFGIERNLRESTLKLVDITGELRLLNPIAQAKRAINQKPKVDLRGDNYSAWYHFFGMAIFAYARATSMPELPPAAWVLRLEHSTYAAHVIYKKKRGNIELAGSRFGQVLAGSFKSPAAAYVAHPYLYPNTQVYDETYITEREVASGRGLRQTGASLMQRALLARQLATDPASFARADWECLKSSLMADPDAFVQSYAEQKLGGRSYPLRSRSAE